MGFKSVISTFLCFSLFLASCTDDSEDLSGTDVSVAQTESLTESYFEDADDVSTVAVWSDDATNGGRTDEGGRRISGISDNRLKCANVTIETASSAQVGSLQGVITIDFGSGCTDAKGNERKGKIIVSYSGLRSAPGASRSVTFENYYINGIKLEGVRTITNTSSSSESSPKFNIDVVGGKAIWPDGTFATREVRHVREIVRAVNPQQDQWTVSQNPSSAFAASGTNRDGKAYQVNITKSLVYKCDCATGNKVFMAVEGTRELIVDGEKTVIDYGNGTCDRYITITVNGESREVEVGANN